MQSRYYAPEVGRFISADAFASTDVGGALSTNMFAYCENNPIVRSDPTGEIYHIIAGAAIGALINMGTQILANSIAGVPLTDNLGIAAITGAVSGAFAASGVGAVGQGLVGAATNIASYVATTPKGERNPVECAIEATVGGISGFRGGSGLTATKKVASQVNIINKNMHAAKKSVKALRTVNTCINRISCEIHARINSAIKTNMALGAVRGFWSKAKSFFGVKIL